MGRAETGHVGEGRAGEGRAERGHPPKGRGTVRVGDTLPPLEIPITRTLIVAGAIASRDYQDVHHDVELAKERGSPDIFMNILTTNGLVGRYITDHFGPRAALRQVKIRLGAPNYPGDTMVLTGTVEEVTRAPEGVTATVRVVGANGMGKHVTGMVTVTVGGAAARAGETGQSDETGGAASRGAALAGKAGDAPPGGVDPAGKTSPAGKAASGGSAPGAAASDGVAPVGESSPASGSAPGSAAPGGAAPVGSPPVVAGGAA